MSCAILERFFDDPNLKLWDYDPDTLLPNLPTMVTFPNLHDFYEDWRKDLVSTGVDIRLETEVAEILKRSDEGVTLQARRKNKDLTTEVYDEMVLCVLADDAVKLLGNTATWKEKCVLRGAKFFDVSERYVRLHGRQLAQS